MMKTSTDPPAFRVRPAQPEEAGAFFAQTPEQDAQMGAIGHVRMRTMAIQLPEELFERLKAYLKKNNLKQKQFIIGLIEDALEQDEEDTTAQADSENASETEEPDEPDMDAEEE